MERKAGRSLPSPGLPMKALDGVGESFALLSSALGAAQAIRALVGLRLATLGLASGQDRMLIALRDTRGLSVSTLANKLTVRPSTVSKMADRLAEKGLLTRLDDPNDHRRTYVELTPEGIAASEKVAELCNQIDAELVLSLSSEEITTMTNGVAILERMAESRLRRLR